MQNKFYTYAYLRIDGTPYYIGKGSGNRAYSGKGRNCNTPTDVSLILILKKNLTEEEAFKHEIYMIAIFGKKHDGTGILMNVSDGGSAPPRICGDRHHMKTVEYRKRVSEKLTGKKSHPCSEENKRKLRELGRKRTGELSSTAQWWKITFEDGREIIRCGLSNWCKENGYQKSALAKLSKGLEGRKKHKDIVKIERVRETDP
jgi:hypothetical protein